MERMQRLALHREDDGEGPCEVLKGSCFAAAIWRLL